MARAKGVGSLSADFGFVVRVTDIAWFFVGIGVQLVSLIPTQLLVEAHGEAAKQDVVKIADRAHGVGIVLIFLAVAVLAPVAEELLFRGLLLRCLLRRMEPGPAVFLSAVIFGVVHVRRPVGRHADRASRDHLAGPRLGDPGRPHGRAVPLDHAAHGLQHPDRRRPVCLIRRFLRTGVPRSRPLKVSAVAAETLPGSDCWEVRECTVHGVPKRHWSRSACTSPSASSRSAGAVVARRRRGRRPTARSPLGRVLDLRACSSTASAALPRRRGRGAF